jgi:hypothetical protein
LWHNSTEVRERGLVADPVGVIADRNQELSSKFGANAVELDEVGGSVCHQRINLNVELLDLIVQGLPSAREVAQGKLGACEVHPFGSGCQ